MAGRKNFISGSILTAADVNGFLMDQSVMVFDDATARTAAIPTASEGMVTYLKDEDAVTVFDGSAYKRVGGLIEVKSVLKTDTFSASVTAGNNVAVDDLSITHEVQDPANKLIISAFFGVAADSGGNSRVGIAINDGTGLIAVGAAAGSRTQVTAGGRAHDNNTQSVVMRSVTFVHTPGSGSKTYTVRAINVSTATRTIFVNRSQDDTNDSSFSRGVSSLVIQEVAV